jgi:hypothetical protein
LAGARLTESGFGDRANVVASDIFRSVPTGGDLYVLRNVLHDWDDGSALEILRACRSAMSSEARLLVIGYPLDGATSRGVTIDLTLLVLTGGRERTLAEYRHLLDVTGFVVDEIIRTAAGPEMFVARPAGSPDP